MCQAVSDIYKERMDKWIKDIVLKNTLAKIDISKEEYLKSLKKVFEDLEITYGKTKQERKNERSA